MPSDVLDFLRAIHEDASGKVEIRLLGDTKLNHGLRPIQRYFHADDLADKLPRIKAHAEAYGYAVFFGVLPRLTEGGTAADVGPARVLWCDLDYKDVPEPDAWRRIDAFPVPPSIIVSSGHGLHLYWRLQEPEAPHILASICRRIAYALGGDRCYDPARILRLPGSRNLKGCWAADGYLFDADTAPVTEIRRYEPSRCVQPFDFDDLPEAPAEQDAKRASVKREAKQIGATLPEVVAEALARSPRLTALWHSQGKDRGDTSGSGYDLSFACSLVCMGIRDSDTLDAAVSARPRVAGSKPASVRSIRRTVDRALAIVPEAPMPDRGEEPPPPDDPFDYAPAEDQPSDRRPIVVVNRERLAMLEATWGAVLAGNTPPRLFQRAGALAVLRFAPDAATEIKAASVPDITGIAIRSARFVTERTTQSGEVQRSPADPAPLAMADMVANPDPGLPVIDAIVRSPVIDRRGQLVAAPGYDARSGLYYDPPEGFTLPEVPTDAESVILARRVILDDWLGEFPFASESDKAHALGLLVLPFVRRMIAGPTPLHLIEASERGTGKSLLAEVLCAPALGRFPDGAPLADNDDEVRKKITATLMARPQVVLFDNLDGRVDSPALCIALTASRWEDRILGMSGNASLPIDCAWIATGNNAELSTDIARRTVRMRLDRGMERPWEFKPTRANLRPWTMEHRAELTAAALCICASWVEAGKKPGTATLGSFEAWAAVVGGIVEHAGLTGFLANIREQYEQADPVHNEWRGLVLEWWHSHGTAPISASTLAAMADQHEMLNSVLATALTARSRASRVGRGLARQKGRIFAGLRLCAKIDASNNGTLWMLEVAEPESVPTRRGPTPVDPAPNGWNRSYD